MSRKPKSRLKTLQDNAPEMLSTLRATRDILHNALNDNYFDRDVFTRLQERVLDVLRLALPDYTYVPKMEDKGQKDIEVNARLIAEAPDMYELLKSVANYKPDFIWDVVFRAKELLARIDEEEVAVNE